MGAMADFTIAFHCGEKTHTVAVTTREDDDQSLEEWLSEKLERRMAAVDTEGGPVLYPLAPRFAVFPTASGGFQMIPTDQITLIEVEPTDGP